MPDEKTAKHTVTSNEQFIADLCETYPAANSVSQALLMAAQDGMNFKQAVDNDLETFIRETVRDELDK